MLNVKCTDRRIDWSITASNGMQVGDWVWSPSPLNPPEVNTDAPFLRLGQIISLCRNCTHVMIEFPQLLITGLDGNKHPHRCFASLDELSIGPEPNPTFTAEDYVLAQPTKGHIHER